MHRGLRAPSFVLTLLATLPVLALACGSDDDPAGTPDASSDGTSSGEATSSSGGNGASSGDNGSSSGDNGSSSGGNGSSSSGEASSSSGDNGASSGGSSSGEASSSSSGDNGSSSGGSSSSGGVDACALQPEVCDGAGDENCNGQVDEGCGRCPLMNNACAQGCCALDRWQFPGPYSEYGSSIAVDSKGNVFFAYTEPNSGVWRASMQIYDAVPGTWRKVALGGGSLQNRVIVDAQDRVHVLHADYSSQRAVMYRRSTDHGVSFSADETLGNGIIGADIDMAIDSQGQPHVFYNRNSGNNGSFGEFVYAKRNVNGGWTQEALDKTTRANGAGRIELGFADRPVIVTSAYQPDGGSVGSKRVMFHNGNRWVYENIALENNGYHFPSITLREHTVRLLADGTIEVLYARKQGSAAAELVLATRGPGVNDAWVNQPLGLEAGATGSELFLDAQGRRAIVGDGLTLHRELTPGNWTTTALGVPGSVVSPARRGQFLYLGYTDNPAGRLPTFKLVDLGVP